VEEALTVNRAIGALMARGHTSETAQAELGRQANEARQSLYSSATRLLMAASSD
jgi:hypothetical protein